MGDTLNHINFAATEKKYTRLRKKPLGRIELVAVALGGMIGGGIFSILGVAVEIVGGAAPLAILLGGVLAFFAAYSYVKLAVYYKDEGATYSFFRKTFPENPFAASVIGWLVTFGYISTLALYAFTFSSYLAAVIPRTNGLLIREAIAGTILLVFALVNILSVKGMGVIEDIMVFIKIAILLVISGLFIGSGDLSNLAPSINGDFSIPSMIIVSSITFVAFEGFQLVIHAYNETEDPDKDVPFAIYWAVGAAVFIYFVLAVGALSAIPKEQIIQDKEFALAAGAKNILGGFGQFIIILGALLATSSAISGTFFGASRLMAVISHDGFFPKILSKRRKNHTPAYSTVTMGVLAFILIVTGGLETILEFGSMTFIIVSILMSFANYKIRHKTKTHVSIAIIAMIALFVGAVSLIYYEATTEIKNVFYILGIFFLVLLFATIYAKVQNSSN